MKKSFLRALFAVMAVFVLSVVPSLSNLTVDAADFDAVPSSEIVEITASAQGEEGREDVTMLIDGDVETKWLGFENETYTITLRLADAKNVVKYALTSANDHPERDPSGWVLSGSNNGSDWTKVDEQSGQTFSERFERVVFEVDNPGSYEYYRLEILEFEDDHLSQLAELELAVGEAAGEDPADEDETPAGEDPTDEDETPAGEDPTDEDETPAGEAPADEDETPAPVENPQTSDMTNNSLYLVLAGGSLLAVLFLGYAKKRSEA